MSDLTPEREAEIRAAVKHALDELDRFGDTRSPYEIDPSGDGWYALDSLLDLLDAERSRRAECDAELISLREELKAARASSNAFECDVDAMCDRLAERDAELVALREQLTARETVPAVDVAATDRLAPARVSWQAGAACGIKAALAGGTVRLFCGGRAVSAYASEACEVVAFADGTAQLVLPASAQDMTVDLFVVENANGTEVARCVCPRVAAVDAKKAGE